MPDQLDARIRALVREIVDSAPPTPSFDLSAGATLSVDRHRMSPRMRVIAGVAACVVVALVIAGVVLIPQSDRSSVRSPAPTGCSGKAYVNNQGDNTVSAITLATGAVSAPIAVGANPGGLAVTPDGKQVYVANPGESKANGTVSVIDTATGRGVGDHPRRQGRESWRSLPTASRRTCSTPADAHRVGDRHGDR